MKHRSSLTGLLVLLAVPLLVGTACGSDEDDADSAAVTTTTAADDEGGGGAGELLGLFRIAPGDCAAGAVTSGSSFRMVQSGGTPDAGPFVDNADSSCGDTTWSALTPGTQGGLLSGDHQPAPVPPFDTAKNGAAASIIEPVTFYAVGFALSSEETDPVGGSATPRPTISVDDAGALSGDLSALLVSWNEQQFNQGSPKPDGSVSGGTGPVTGTYDADTGAYTLDWTSEIAGGPFNGFTGVWHLEGVFEAG